MNKGHGVTGDWHFMRGKLDFRCTNDYLFRALMQTHDDVRIGLVAAFIGCEPEEINSCEVKNPIVLGKTIDAKNIILDILVCVNGSRLINLEMQVVNEHNWPERSLLYLCRIFDRINRGSDYKDVKPAWQIGITDFSVFEGNTKFLRTYKMTDKSDGQIYSEKFVISIMDLKNIDHATETDKASKLDLWARLFSAETWEELQEVASQSPIIDKAVGYMFTLTKDEEIRMQMEAREEYYKNERTNQLLLKEAREDVDKYRLEAEHYKRLAEEQNNKLADKDAKLADKDAKLADKDAKLADQDAKLADKDAKLAEQNAKLADKDAKLADQNALLAKYERKYGKL
ncbi:MAG: Rpn family recombination-promoting nuclease/putative transposase [Lachnospiraceae bacterium]|nr:Rpn family recombination-promoting nuclease/putative transposase [Lachnospiraceae bacterium]